MAACKKQTIALSPIGLPAKSQGSVGTKSCFGAIYLQPSDQNSVPVKNKSVVEIRRIELPSFASPDIEKRVVETSASATLR
jgi:hypothetical protein